MSTRKNRRILLVDDLPTIHDDFRKILAPLTDTTDLDADEAILFGQPTGASNVIFELASAFQGVEALEKVRAARLAGLPYAMAFIDMRMPPGWDGVETVEHLWAEDPGLQVVLCQPPERRPSRSAANAVLRSLWRHRWRQRDHLGSREYDEDIHNESSPKISGELAWIRPSPP